MKKIFSLIQLAVLSAGSSAFAIVGGPFDNGDYNVLVERSGYYQSSYSFKNGSGYSLWSPDNLQGALLQGQTLTPNVSTGALSTPGGQANNANRSVLYYKGVTYFGNALGEVDVAARRISGYANASSEYSVSAVSTEQNANFFTQSNVTSFSSATVVANGRSYVANLNWQGKITATQPQLRYTGKGELTIIAPNGRSAIASLAYDAYSSLVQSIASSIQTVPNGPPPNYAAAQLAISQSLNGNPGTPARTTVTPAYGQALNGTTPVDLNRNGVTNDDLVVTGQTVTNTAAVAPTDGLNSFLEGTGPNQSYRDAENVKIKVRGYRRFF
jgi:hypothetical protein